MKKYFLFLLCIFMLPVCHAETLLIESESFEELGGWSIDQQYMDQMGSPVLLAHGLGKPVADAITSIEFSETGTYQVWVRTREWSGYPEPDLTPGRFQLLINGKKLNTTFGNKRTDWHWQSGGTASIDQKKVSLALHDLTGFNGRCDAILFSNDPDFTPPCNDDLNSFRCKALGLSEQPEDAGEFDLVVIGGGIAGTCASISAARLGLQVALIQDRPLLGGNNSSEVRVHLMGKIKLDPYPELGNIVNEIAPLQDKGNGAPAKFFEDEKKLQVVQNEKNIHLFLNMHANKVETKDSRVVAVVARHTRTNKLIRFSAPLFVDCTGDGTIGYLAGADFRMGRESRRQTGESLAPEDPDKMTMGSSVQWYTKAFDQSVSFPECPWAVQFTEESCQRLTKGDWDWETGLNMDQIYEFESIRDYGLSVVFGNWAFLKNQSKDKAKYANKNLDWVAYIAGKRESRRLMGDIVLQEQDMRTNRVYPDSFVKATWSIDLHYPHPDNTKHFPGKEFRTIARHVRSDNYLIPYRCFYSRNIENLMMAGRNISVTHAALGKVRVMGTCGMMGEVVGMAASLCKKHQVNPKVVYYNHLDELTEMVKSGIEK
jgi:FAD-dependent oxidoreductase family protein